MKFVEENIVWQEVPGSVSLTFLISGCPLRCPGCHSSYSWEPGAGRSLTSAYLTSRIERYQGLIGCVCFLGGDWCVQELKALLAVVRDAGLDTCLYSGYEEVSPLLLPLLTFAKTGPWRRELGGLDSPKTNQRFFEVQTGKILNHLFIKE